MILDAYAGIGGWDEGIRQAGYDGTLVGVEHWDDACRTAVAAGHDRICADVETFPLDHLVGKVDGLVMSPPCTDFSLAGKKAGVDGDAGRLIWTVPAWVKTLRPRWFAMEQVPPAIGWWEQFAVEFQKLGYRTWVGVVNAADYGVPQTRRRAFLLGALDRVPVPPEPTHSRTPGATLFGETLPWVSMADALGWGAAQTPCVTITSGGTNTGGAEPVAHWSRFKQSRSWVLDRRQPYVAGVSTVRPIDCQTEPASAIPVTVGASSVWQVRPATTIVGSYRPDIVAAPGFRTTVSRQNAEGSVSITQQDALILQSFRPDYPLHGSRTSQFKQVGNAVCPTVARALCAQFLEDR